MNDSTQIPEAWRQATQWLLPVSIVGLVAVMVIPLPTALLDLLLSFDVSLSLVVLLTAVYVARPSTFSTFPSVLLLLTVFRLGLNVATTRRILLHGPEGPEAAGHVIEAFGQFVVGGSVVVGTVIFLVLLAVQFIVINHGATRISEVAARFTLDAMPGRQMAIDADLNAGLIDEVEARERRKAISADADFYGSMDGAVRFTQRDAVASLIIVAINLLAGIGIGVLQAGMPITEALVTYSILTIGDGLVSAIPALLLSVAGGLLTTRSDTGIDLGSELGQQLLSSPTPLTVAAGALGTLALVPGLPTLAFLTMSGGVGALAMAMKRKQRAEPDPSEDVPASAPPIEEPIEPLLAVDPVSIEVGYDLVELAGSDSPGGLLDRIREIRRQVALELGFIVPPVRVRDNLKLSPDGYQLLLRGAEIGQGRLQRRKMLAIDPGDVKEQIEGEKTLDPAFGIEALWIREELADTARSAGYTVVDQTSVLATHLSQVVRRYAPELLGRQQTQDLLDTLAKTDPKLVEELVPERCTIGQVQKVLQALLRESVSIRDMHSICEAMADRGPEPFNLDEVLARVRQALRRSLVRPFVVDGALRVVTLAPEVEQGILSAITNDGHESLDAKGTQSLVHRTARAIREAPAGAQPVVLCSSGSARTFLRRLTNSVLPTVPMFSAHEVPEGVKVQAVGQIQ
ncbi:MAG: flagellar biosynthesis protein FlhA [bacterium]|nr:flagellar biosynthesis protein FlhA [bacterium]